MAGDLDSFGQLYDRYFPRVYDFAWRVIRDADEAASVAEGVFATAMTSMAELSSAASFRSWLFAIAYRATVSRAAGLDRVSGPFRPVHEEAFGSFEVPDACFIADPSVTGGDAATAEMVWEAATALNPRDYAILDLHVRQGLDSAEIAPVLAMSKSNAYTLVTRMKAAAADVMTGYILARTGGQACDQLQSVVAPFDFPPFTDEIRRAVDAHAHECDACKATVKAIPEPLPILGAFAGVSSPMPLKGDVWRSIAASWHVPPGQARLATAGAGEPGLASAGLPPSPLAGGGGIALGGGGAAGGIGGAYGGQGWDRQRVVWFVAAAAVMLVFAFAIGAVLVWLAGGGDGGGTSAASETRTATATWTASAVISLTPGVAVSSPTPETPTPVPSDTATPTPTDTPVPETPTSTAPAATPSPVQTTGVRSATPTPKKSGTATPTPIAAGTSTPTP
jgi:RNA polymerase sigma factor (sigma-70 family)